MNSDPLNLTPSHTHVIFITFAALLHLIAATFNHYTEYQSSLNMTDFFPTPTPIPDLDHLPNEILDNILGRLAFKDLTNARFINRQCADVGARRLSRDQVFISPQDAAMKHVRIILKNPEICRNIRTLKYDVALLREIKWTENLE